jgi:hypothetical protein
MPNKCVHGNVVCSRCVTVTDAARRMADQINARVAFTPWDTLIGSWMIFRLVDGGTDGVLYDSRADAAKHTFYRHHAIFCMRNAQGGVSAKDCQLYLDVHRQVYEAGGDFREPEAPQIIISTRGYDIMTGKVNPRAN